MRIWDPATGDQQAELTGHTGWGRAVAALPGPNGRTLLATGGDDGTVRIWDPASGAELVRVVMAAPVLSLVVSSTESDPSAAAGSVLVVSGAGGFAVFDVADLSSRSSRPAR